MEEAATPFPREETTPPVTNIYFGAILSWPRLAVLPNAPGLSDLRRSDVHTIMVAKRRRVNPTRPLRRFKKFIARIIYRARIARVWVIECVWIAPNRCRASCTKGQHPIRVAGSNFSSVDGFPKWGSCVSFSSSDAPLIATADCK
jgi:hypothetical protein